MTSKDDVDGLELIQKVDIIEDEVDTITTEYNATTFEDFEIYTTYEKEYALSNYDTFVVEVLEEVSRYENEIYFAVPICGVLSIVILTYLLISIGHTKGKEGIDLNDLDELPLELLLIVGGLIITVAAALIVSAGDIGERFYKLYLSGIICVYFVTYSILAIGITTILKRLKAKVFWKTTLIGKCLLKFIDIINKLEDTLKPKNNPNHYALKLVFFIFLYIAIMIIVLAIFNGEALGIIIDIGIAIYAFYKIVQRISCFERIEKQLKEIYEGNNEERLLEEEFTSEFKNVVEYINDISNGFENAIQEGVKSERLKTELITNVSHDIKTPLTSIINYVDLLKQENIESEKAKEYIEILESKAQRLKRLTEDLVEASKASSGNVKLNLEKINIGELINQTTGEFEDKFNERGLEIITSIPEEEAYIEADSRYMYRIIENAFSNISKYALENSRVYVDIKLFENKVNVKIKNISSSKLNISTEELMQRFVRGDKSRTTEGSGLRIIYCTKFNRTSKWKL